MISAKLPNKIRVAPFAKVDTTLQGAEGDTITVPKFAYIGDAEDVAEGVECGLTTLETSSEKVTVKKAMKAVGLTDEAVLSAHGDPVGETNNQLALSIASKIDNDCMDALTDEKAEGIYGAELNEAIVVISSFSGASISYAVKRKGDPIQGYVTVTDSKVTFTKGEYSAS